MWQNEYGSGANLMELNEFVSKRTSLIDKLNIYACKHTKKTEYYQENGVYIMYCDGCERVFVYYVFALLISI